MTLHHKNAKRAIVVADASSATTPNLYRFVARFYTVAVSPSSNRRETCAGIAPLTGMHCWEFHHYVEGKEYQWFWRALTAAGEIHSESKLKFKTFLQALEDAKQNGFDQELHEWYLAAPNASPCMKTVSDPPRSAHGGRS